MGLSEPRFRWKIGCHPQHYIKTTLTSEKMVSPGQPRGGDEVEIGIRLELAYSEVHPERSRDGNMERNLAERFETMGRREQEAI